MGATTITGLVAGRRTVSWTTVRRRQGRWEVAGRGSAESPADAGEGWQAAACRGVRSPVRLALPADRALLRVMDLPSSDPVELRGMVDLQVDKFSPFPVDQLVSSFEILGEHEGRTRVLAAAVRRGVLDAAVAGLDGARLTVREVDLDLPGWWDALGALGAREEPGRVLHVVAGDEALVLVAAQEGLPLACRSVARPSDPGALAEELSDEVRLTLASVEAEWGAAPGSTGLCFWADPADTAEPGSGPDGAAFERRSLEGAPPLSECIARRAAAGRGTPRLDLAPPEWTEARRRRAVSGRFWFATLAFLVAWAAAVVAFGAGLAWRRSRLEGHRTDVETVEQPAEAARRLFGRVRALEDYADRTHSALEVLREVSTRLPPGVELTSLAYRKGRSVNLRGEAANPNAVYDLVTELEQSGLFSEVKPEGIATRVTPSGPSSDFRINAVLPGEAP